MGTTTIMRHGAGMATVRGGIRARQVAVVPPKTGTMPAGHMRVKLAMVVLAVVAMVAPSAAAEEEQVATE